MNQREKGYWADLDNLKQELVSVASQTGPSPGNHNDSIPGDVAHALADKEDDLSLPQHALEGEEWPCPCVAHDWDISCSHAVQSGLV